MALTLEDVRRIAALARIEIDEAEALRVLEQLSGIFGLLEQMRSVDTEGVVPMSHPLGGAQRLREDVVTEVDSRDANMRLAPAQQDGLFLVPRVIE